MGLEERYDFSQIENQAVKLVIEEIEYQLTPEDLEDNEEFVLDIATYALNHLKPAYSFTLLGKLYSQNLENETYQREVEDVVAAAIKKIKASPK